MSGDEATRAAERVARQSYGRLVAWLAYRWRDVAAAEDALAEAFAAALRTWPRDGVPRSPEAWLMTAARRNLLKGARGARRADDLARATSPLDEAVMDETFAVPDQRLRLMLVCAHPAIDSTLHAALMLQVVMGVDAARIARLFLTTPEAMAKRLSRGKAKIREAGIRFEEPDASDLPARLDAVLEAIYGAYALEAAYDAPGGGGADLTEEALHLAELVAALKPDQPEALGLLALLTYCEARKGARLDDGGRFIPLDRQDPARWSGRLVARADAVLHRASRAGLLGPFQIEAAIQSAHCERARGGETPWAAIVTLYEALLALAPSTGARLGRALALARARSDPLAGLALLDEIDPAGLAGHQPWWAVRALLLVEAGNHDAATEALRRARDLSTHPAVIAHFEGQLAALAPSRRH